MAALLYSEQPKYSAVIFRRSYPQLTQEGGLVERSKQWLLGKGPEWNASERRWRFPAGGSLAFRHMESDDERYAHQGAEYHFVGWDELTHLPTDTPYRYLLSRIRRAEGDPIPLRCVSTSNPGGPGHAWVKARFLGTPTPDRLFIPARLDDNPHQDRAAYEAQLAQLHPTDYQRLRHGDWSVTDEALIRREWVRSIPRDQLPPDLRWVRVWDLAASEREQADETASIRAAMHNGTLYLDAPIAGRWAWPQARAVILQTAQAEATQVRTVGVEAVASWRVALDDLAQDPVWGRVALRRLGVDGKDKVTRASPWAAMASRGQVVLVQGPDWSGWVDQWTAFPGAAHDDRVDAVSLAAYMLSQAAQATGWLGAFKAGGR